MENYQIFNANCIDWLKVRERDSVHAICTDPPYGMVEFSEKEIGKLRAGRGGIWRLPPMINGSKRDPLPRFTVLGNKEKQALEDFFLLWGTHIKRILVPGAHVAIAGNSYLQTHVQKALLQAGFEIRGAIIRVYQSFRGGDRPKNAEKEFPGVCVTAKGCYEPWMLFRKPISEKTVAANLRKWKTGGLRMLAENKPFPELIMSTKTPKIEEEISNHPCLKPQHFMRLLVRALLPLGEGIVVDPFMGGGSTIAAATNIGYDAIGIEIDCEYFKMAEKGIPILASLYPEFEGDILMPVITNGNAKNNLSDTTPLLLFA